MKEWVSLGGEGSLRDDSSEDTNMFMEWCKRSKKMMDAKEKNTIDTAHMERNICFMINSLLLHELLSFKFLDK